MNGEGQEKEGSAESGLGRKEMGRGKAPPSMRYAVSHEWLTPVWPWFRSGGIDFEAN
jgi:hypothetical protein